MKVGDILVYCYSYNARYPQFARVTRATEKSVWVESVPKKWLEHDGYGQNGKVIPNLGGKTTPIKGSFRIKHSNYLNADYIKIDRCMATIWDGTPEDEYTD